jgi:rubrerythrin
MIDKQRVCTVLVDMISDENKATVDYEQFKAELQAKRDKALVNKISKDEGKHAKKLKSLYLRLKCYQDDASLP